MQALAPKILNSRTSRNLTAICKFPRSDMSEISIPVRRVDKGLERSGSFMKSNGRLTKMPIQEGPF